MLTSSPGHILGEPVEGTHDLGDRVDADVEQFTTNLAYAATYNVRVRDIRERNGSEVRQVVGVRTPSHHMRLPTKLMSL